MYAVIRTGGKQYRVTPGDVLEVEHLSVKGEDVRFTPLLVSTDDGRTLHGREAGEFPVSAKLLGDAKGDKITVFKYRNKTGYAAKTGHRQVYSLIEITGIGDGAAEAPPAPKAEAKARDEAPAAEPAAETTDPAAETTDPAAEAEAEVAEAAEAETDAAPGAGS